MIYYIIPPIIIIASITILILFLFRKTSAIPQDLVRSNPEVFYSSKIRSVLSGVGHFFLAFAEALIRRVKLFSLKFHNTSNDWVQAIRKKRENGKIEKEKRDASLKQMIPQDKDERREVFPHNIKNEDSGEIVFERNVRLRKSQPIISDSVTLPEKQIAKDVVKEKLEDVLINRIAMNPRDIEAYERLGDYYMEQQSAKDALECYRQVLKLSPAHHKAKMKIRRLERMFSRN